MFEFINALKELVKLNNHIFLFLSIIMFSYLVFVCYEGEDGCGGTIVNPKLLLDPKKKKKKKKILSKVNENKELSINHTNFHKPTTNLLESFSSVSKYIGNLSNWKLKNLKQKLRGYR